MFWEYAEVMAARHHECTKCQWIQHPRERARRPGQLPSGRSAAYGSRQEHGCLRPPGTGGQADLLQEACSADLLPAQLPARHHSPYLGQGAPPLDSQPWCSLSGPLLPKGSRYLSLTVPWILTPKGTLTDYPTSQGLRAASKNQVLPCQAPRSGLREPVSRNCGAKGGSIENHLPLGDLAERGSWASPGKPCCSGGFSKRVAGVDAEGQMIPSSGFLEHL